MRNQDLRIYRHVKQERRVAFRILNIVVALATTILFASTAVGGARVGDWEFGFENEGAEVKARTAFTPARSNSGSVTIPRLLIKRIESDSPVEIFIIDTHDLEKDQCVYQDWKIAIDSTDIPVLGYTFEPAKTELKTKLGTPVDKFWNLFKKGLTLTVETLQKCDSLAGKSEPVSHRFSLRGSSAAFKFVLGKIE